MHDLVWFLVPIAKSIIVNINRVHGGE